MNYIEIMASTEADSWVKSLFNRAVAAVAIAVVGLSFGTPVYAAEASSSAHGRPAERIEGIWIWQSKYVSDLAEQDKMLDFLGRHGFNRLLVQVPWNHEAPATAPEILYPTPLARLITEAGKRHMKVEALDGDTHMGDPDEQPHSLATVDAILAFNKAHPDSKFVGLHWDIEPYTRQDWKTMALRVPIETNYLSLLEQTETKLHAAGSAMTLAVDIPMWYDDKTDPDDNCILDFHGHTKNLYQHVEDVTDYVGIMSYRQKALGPNSASAMVANELAYAESIGKYVCPAFETLQLSDTPTITFYGKSAEQFLTQKKILETSLADRPGFGGMFVHCYPSVVAVLEPAK